MDLFLRDKDSDADLVSRMPAGERAQYQRFGHLWIESAFCGRKFIVYKPTGLTSSNHHREPDVLTTVEVLDFLCDSKSGCSVRMQDEGNGSVMVFGHISKRGFDYDVFMSVPSRMKLRWDARAVPGGIARSLSFAVLIKTRNRSDFFSMGNTYCESPNGFAALYPNVTGAGNFVF